MSWRPMNETKQDRDRQDAAAKVLTEMWLCDVKDVSPRLYCFDWAIVVGDEIKAFAEYKFRHRIQFDTYPDLMLSLAKAKTMREFAELAGVKALMIWEFEGSPEFLAYVDLCDVMVRKDVTVKWSGNHRNQNGDLEPVVMIPLHLVTLTRKR